ncbi:MAG TPA: amidohydrolase family protein [Myxococcaceae bacterium]|nr:amidohydrolase family protein [Myxococcaceae bacterium]
MPGIVDAHTHLFPERLAAAIRAFFVQHISGDVFRYPSDWREARAALAQAGVDLCWTLPYVRRPGAASALNRWMAETFAADPFVEPGATVHPGDDVAAVADEALGALGLRLFKLHCSVGNYPLTDERLDPLWRRVSEAGIPVVVHLGHAATGSTAAHELGALEAVAGRWPAATIILAHLAAPAVEEGLALLRRHPSLHADLTPVVARLAPLRPGALDGLASRILFGSDVPNVGVRVEEALAAVRALGLSPGDEALVLGGNAARLVPPRS